MVLLVRGDVQWREPSTNSTAMQAVKKDKKTGLPEKYLAGSPNRDARASSIKEGQEAYKQGKRLPDSYFDERQKFGEGGEMFKKKFGSALGSGLGGAIGGAASALAQYGISELARKKRKEYEHGGILGHDGDPEKEDKKKNKVKLKDRLVDENMEKGPLTERTVHDVLDYLAKENVKYKEEQRKNIEGQKKMDDFEKRIEDIQWMEKGGKVKKGKGAKEGKKPLNASTIATLKKKAKESGISLDKLKQVYRRGQGAYLSSGSRPKTSMAAWAMGRVNSFIKGSKKHDTDLR